MQEANDAKAQISSLAIERLVQEATAKARAKNARLAKLKERNEIYLAARRAGEFDFDDEDAFDVEVTREL
jgi:hypothetical protein